MPASPTPPRTGIYIASKTTHAKRWRDLRSIGHPIISTWIDEAGSADEEHQRFAEIRAAYAFIVYREPGESLADASVEIDAALAFGVPVFAVGCDEFSFTHHADVRCLETLSDALDAAVQAAPTDAVAGSAGFRVGEEK